VEESMTNVEDVIRERNKAYFELETGETGEHPAHWKLSWIGRRTLYKTREHIEPPEMNEEHFKRITYRYRNDDGFRQTDRDVKHFLALFEEKEVAKNAYYTRRQTMEAIEMLKKFPNCNKEALQKAYPLIDVEKVLKSKYLQDLSLWQEFDREKETG
jgi:large subunit ribosomal protein L47